MPSDPLPLKTQQTSVRTLCSLIAAVLAVLLWSSSDAHASCGRYLYRQGKPVEHSGDSASRTDSLPTAKNSLADVTSRPLHQIPARRCTGPGCSESPLPLAPVSVPFTLQRTTDVGVLSDLRATSPSLLDGLLEVRSERIASSEPAEVFRPPCRLKLTAVRC
jgi:hypothetical protein